MACITPPLKTEDDQLLTNFFIVNLAMYLLCKGERKEMFTLKCSWPLLLPCVMSWHLQEPVLVPLLTAGDVSAQMYQRLGVFCLQYLHHSNKSIPVLRPCSFTLLVLQLRQGRTALDFCSNQQQYFLLLPLGSNITVNLDHSQLWEGERA